MARAQAMPRGPAHAIGNSWEWVYEELRCRDQALADREPHELRD